MNKYPDWPFDAEFRRKPVGIPEIPDSKRTKPPEMKPPNVYKSIDEAVDAGLTTIPATKEQLIPHGDTEIAPLVQKDIAERAKVGCKKYGELLKSNNGRNALWDAYQEALDLCMYLRQKIEEEK